MGVPVPLNWRTPAASEVYTAAPVLGRTLTTFAGAFNHLNNIQVPGFAPSMAYQDPPEATDAIDLGYIVGQPDHYESVRVPYYVPAGVARLYVALMIIAWQEGGDQAPQVDVSLHKPNGDSIDVGWRASRETGLAGGEWRSGAYWLTAPTLLESTMTAPSDISGAQRSPSLLSTDGHDDEMVVLHVDCIRVRIASVFILPAPVTKL